MRNRDPVQDSRNLTPKTSLFPMGDVSTDSGTTEGHPLTLGLPQDASPAVPGQESYATKAYVDELVSKFASESYVDYAISTALSQFAAKKNTIPAADQDKELPRSVDDHKL